MADFNLLTTEAQAKTGCTHELVITHEDLTTAGVTGTSEVQVTIPAGSLIQTGFHLLDTEFVSPSSSSLTYRVGDDDDDDNFLSLTQVDAANTPVVYKVGAVTLVTGKVYAAADTLDIDFISVGDNLADFTAGKLRFFLKLIDLDTLNN